MGGQAQLIYHEDKEYAAPLQGKLIKVPGMAFCVSYRMATMLGGAFLPLAPDSTPSTM